MFMFMYLTLTLDKVLAHGLKGYSLFRCHRKWGHCSRIDINSNTSACAKNNGVLNFGNGIMKNPRPCLLE